VLFTLTNVSSPGSNPYEFVEDIPLVFPKYMSCVFDAAAFRLIPYEQVNPVASINPAAEVTETLLVFNVDGTLPAILKI
jgi:hypothetical protein